jgi:hypothetical protein
LSTIPSATSGAASNEPATIAVYTGTPESRPTTQATVRMTEIPASRRSYLVSRSGSTGRHSPDRGRPLPRLSIVAGLFDTQFTSTIQYRSAAAKILLRNVMMWF